MGMSLQGHGDVRWGVGRGFPLCSGFPPGNPPSFNGSLKRAPIYNASGGGDGGQPQALQLLLELAILVHRNHLLVQDPASNLSSSRWPGRCLGMEQPWGSWGFPVILAFLCKLGVSL